MIENQRRLIVLLETNRGIVAIENFEVFDLWKHQDLKKIKEELKYRYPKFKILILKNIRTRFETALMKSFEFYNKGMNIYIENIEREYKHKRKFKMTRFAFNKEHAKVRTQLAADFSVGKILGGLSFSLYATGKLCIYGAKQIAYGEAHTRRRIGAINTDQMTVGALVSARMDRNEELCDKVVDIPKNIKQLKEEAMARLKTIEVEQAQ